MSVILLKRKRLSERCSELFQATRTHFIFWDWSLITPGIPEMQSN